MKYLVRCSAVFASVVLCSTASFADPATKRHQNENVILVMTDGLRWQEVFQGADASLMNKENGRVVDVPSLQKAYWRETEEARRSSTKGYSK